MSYIIKQNKCIFCNNKVRFTNSDGYMEDSRNLYHFLCVKEYGYHKFCSSVLSTPEKVFVLNHDTINNVHLYKF